MQTETKGYECLHTCGWDNLDDSEVVNERLQRLDILLKVNGEKSF